MRVIVFDIDGILTDGTVQVDENGHEYKRFLLNDIDALNQLSRDGFVIAAITGEDTPLTDYFRKKASWKYFVKGCKHKLEAFKEILFKEDCPLDKAIYIGDGLYDVPVLEYVTNSVCPANAIPAAKKVARIHLHSSGGDGCVVELYESLRMKKFKECAH